MDYFFTLAKYQLNLGLFIINNTEHLDDKNPAKWQFSEKVIKAVMFIKIK